MRSYNSRAGVIAALALATACAPAVMISPVETETAIRARSAEQLSRVTARNTEAVVAGYAPDAVLALPNMAPVSGHEALRRAWGEFFAMPNSRLTWQTTAVDVASSGDLATEYGTFQVTFDTPGGPVTDRGSYVTVWRRIGNDWVIVRDIVTSSQPMAQPTATVPLDISAVEMAAAAGLSWQPFAPPGFPPGAQIVVIHGDPSKATDYALRLRFPDGYRIPLHYHGAGEHVTILSGEMNLAMARDTNTPTRAYGPGDFLYMPPRHSHYGFIRGETFMQLHGIGPFTINLGPGPQ
jgi:ketosteroid isomerase-like protein/quercetin dioxygenase-like cupin family protein